MVISPPLTSMTTRGILDLVLLSTIASIGVSSTGCGATTDHTAMLSRLRDAIHAEVTSPAVLERHNQLVEEVVRSGALEGLRMHEVAARIGRGSPCGVRAICSERGFRPTDWVYDVGRQPGHSDLPAGPTLIVGFDSAGIVERTFYVTRR